MISTKEEAHSAPRSSQPWIFSVWWWFLSLIKEWRDVNRENIYNWFGKFCPFNKNKKTKTKKQHNWWRIVLLENIIPAHTNPWPRYQPRLLQRGVFLLRCPPFVPSIPSRIYAQRARRGGSLEENAHGLTNPFTNLGASQKKKNHTDTRVRRTGCGSS